MTARATRKPEVDHAAVHDAERAAGDHLEAERQERVRSRDAAAAGHASIEVALAEFSKELPRVAKNSEARIPGKNGSAGYSYKYADLADLSDAAVPVLAKHGLSFICAPRQTEGGGYELAGILVHESGGRIEGALPLHGRAAQELGSAITYARRYLLSAMTGIVTDDDDDGQRAQAAAGPTTVDRAPLANRLWAKAGENASLAWVQGVWAEASAAGVMDVEIEHIDGAREPLQAALKRLGDHLASAGA